MTFNATLAQLQPVLGATVINPPLDPPAGDLQFTGISTDTRSLQPGELFLALRGANFDGHEFIRVAVERGAAAVIVDQPIPEPIPQLVVGNTLMAYQSLGHWWRNQFQIPVVAITGSVGKTTTKELIAAVLGLSGKVLKTEANYNNEIGVPRTLLQLGPEHAFAVIEMGMRGPGEIALLSQIARPDLAVITNVGTAHIGRLGSREAIAAAKSELLAEMPKTSVAILNADNPLLLTTAQTVWQGQTLTYGLEAGELRGTLLDAQTLAVGAYKFSLPLVGNHNALNFLAALAVAKVLALDWAPLQASLTVTLPQGRAQRYILGDDIVLLDETYNAGPESMEASLRLLGQTPGQRRRAVLGPMRELGDHSQELHEQVGRVVQQLHLDELLVLDTAAEGAALVAGAGALPTRQFAEAEALVQYLQQTIQPGDRLLFKASHSVGLDRVVSQLREILTQETLTAVQ